MKEKKENARLEKRINDIVLNLEAPSVFRQIKQQAFGIKGASAPHSRKSSVGIKIFTALAVLAVIGLITVGVLFGLKIIAFN